MRSRGLRGQALGRVLDKSSVDLQGLDCEKNEAMHERFQSLSNVGAMSIAEQSRNDIYR